MQGVGYAYPNPPTALVDESWECHLRTVSPESAANSRCLLEDSATSKVRLIRVVLTAINQTSSLRLKHGCPWLRAGWIRARPAVSVAKPAVQQASASFVHRLPESISTDQRSIHLRPRRIPSPLFLSNWSKHSQLHLNIHHELCTFLVMLSCCTLIHQANPPRQSTVASYELLYAFAHGFQQ